MPNPNLPNTWAMNTYYGARYVPKFMGEWSATVAYEPLMIVTYQGNSYTSTTFVPVGAPVTNTTYWALTGNYNAQVEQYRQEVQTFDERITTNTTNIESLTEQVEDIKNKKYLFIGDSYATFKETATKLNYIELACQYNGLDNTDYFEFYISGAGFGVSGNLNFLSVLQNNEASIPDKNLITDIIVLGSANDQSESGPDISAGITAFMNYVKSNYPNAKVYLSSFTKSIESDAQIKALFTVVPTYQNVIEQGGCFIENSQFVMSWLSRFKTDLLHPNNDGVKELAKYLGQFLKTGKVEVNRKFQSASNIGFRVDGWFDFDSGSLCVMNQHNGVVETKFNIGTVVKATTNREITLAGGTSVANNNLILIDALFYPSNNLTLAEGAMWYNNTYYKVQYSFNNNVTTNEGFRADLIFEDATVVIPANSSVTFILPHNFITTL